MITNIPSDNASRTLTISLLRELSLRPRQLQRLREKFCKKSRKMLPIKLKKSRKMLPIKPKKLRKNQPPKKHKMRS